MAGLRKEDPHEPNYSFYYIALSHMLSDLQSSRDPVRSKLNGTLAYRHLETIFKNASASEVGLGHQFEGCSDMFRKILWAD